MSRLESGFTVVTVAGTLVSVLSFVAMAVDMGVLYSSRSGAQKSVDAAALAGAFTFVTNPLFPQPDAAVEHAVQTATSNYILGSAIQASDLSVTVEVEQRKVYVDLNYAQPTYFARILGLNSVPISVQAVARASDNSASAGCTKPWLIPNAMLSGSAPCTACGLGEVLLGPGEGDSVTAWGQSQVGQQFMVRAGNPGSVLAPREFFAMRLNDSLGGNDYQTNITTCSPQVVTCLQSYEIEPGQMIGATTLGVQDLVTIYGSVSPDVWLGAGQYQHPNSTVSSTSHQLVTAAIWDSCDGSIVCTGPSAQHNRLRSGQTSVQAIGFAVFFIEGVGGGALPGTSIDVVVRLVGLSRCGDGGNVNLTELGPYGFPVRLGRVGD